MIIDQIYTGCLAQGAYYIESAGEAAVIDPLREVDPYIKKAGKNGARIKYVFETHFHADFVSGHIDLSKKAGAPIVFGPLADPGFEAHIAQDGEIFKVGNVSIKVLHTPGHTMESTCYLLIDESGKEVALFSGDTLFIGDVGRPDLAQKAASMTQEQLASTLFDSLRTKVMTLPDDVVVYPAHGAGSACGKNMSKETSDLLGRQKATNYALRSNMTREEFVKEVTDGLQAPPAYFPLNVAMNKQGYENYETVMERGMRALSPTAFEVAAEVSGALMLDTRSNQVFYKGFIPNSINIGLDGQFAPWVGALIPDVKQQILLITEVGKEEETVKRLARVGYDQVIGYLEGGFEAWLASGKEMDQVHRITAEAFAERYQQDSITVLDVRRPGEYDAEHVEGAKNIPLDSINDNLSEFPKDQHFFMHCAGGYRSMIAASILKARGWEHFTEVEGGFNAISKTNIPCTSFQCPSTQGKTA
jgi:hydroxyacylglutathione hydrolase